MRIAAHLRVSCLTLILGSVLVSGSGCGDPPNELQERTDLPIPADLESVSSAVTINVITPVIFVPRDQAYPNATQLAAINAAIADNQVWYRTRLGNGMLKFDSVQRVNGALTAAEYLANDTIWSQGPTEIQNALGFGPWTPGHVVVAMGVGLQGWAGGSGTGSTGYAVLGLESLINTGACAGNWWCTPTVWRGTFIHELGHALTLPHSAEPSIMAFHGDYLNKILLNTGAWPERNKVRSTLFFQRTLGLGKADWTSCAVDTDCLTMRCGCNGGTSRVCLANDDYPEYCSFSNWTSCLESQECLTSVCGCNGGTSRVCLPNSQYPTYCTFPNWTACLSGADCATGICGCNGGTSRVCLPNSQYPTYCTFAAYTPCKGDSDCASGWCGCDGGRIKLCLPSTAYPKTCQ